MSFEYKKSLGQNFLKDNNIIKKIVDSIDVTKDDLIIEIGPGAGALTSKLVNKGCDIICFEIDERLKNKLDNIKNENINIIYNDFLKINVNDYINKKYNRLFFVGNLPYYITTAIINKIIEESDPYEIIIMIQKEVAERFMAKPKTKQYSSLSVFLQYNFDIIKICNVNKNCFEPVPKVDSMVIKLKNKVDKFKVKNERFFYKFIKDAFKQKRKNLRIKSRAEELSIKDFVDIINEIIP